MEKYFFSPSLKGFFAETLKEHYEKSENGWPEDAVEISQKEYESLIQGQSSGKIISLTKKGHLTLIDPVIDYQALAEDKKRELLSLASDATGDLKVELTLGLISDEDKEILKSWVKYTKELKTLDFSDIKDESSYNAIEWPESPNT